MPIDLPKPIADFVAANARRDLDGMVRPFTPDAVILDNGKRFDRQASMRAMFEHEVVPVKAIFTPEIIRHEAGRVVVEGPAHGEFPGSPLRFTYSFMLENNAIKALEITL
jgi:hypothetical protein